MEEGLPLACFEVNLREGLEEQLVKSLLFLVSSLKQGNYRAIGEPAIRGDRWMRFDAYRGHENLAYILGKMGGTVRREDDVRKTTGEADTPFYYYTVDFS